MKPTSQGRGRSLTRDAQTVVRDCPGLNIRLAARRITRFFEAGLAGTGLTLAQFNLMAQIAAAADDTIGALALKLDLDPSTLSRNLAGLERAGLVEIAVIESDLRRRAVWLTEKGARTLEAAIPVWRQLCRALDERLPLQTIQALADATERLSPSPRK